MPPPAPVTEREPCAASRASQTPSDGRGSTDAGTVAQPLLNSSNTHLEHQFEATRLNTSMSTNPAALADTLFACFRTIRAPTPHLIRPKPIDAWAAAAQWRAEKQYAEGYRDLLGRFLTERGHRFLTYLEEDPDGGWRLHFFADHVALAFLEEITGTECGPGDPVNFDVARFILRRPGGYQ